MYIIILLFVWPSNRSLGRSTQAGRAIYLIVTLKIVRAGYRVGIDRCGRAVKRRG